MRERKKERKKERERERERERETELFYGGEVQLDVSPKWTA